MKMASKAVEKETVVDAVLRDQPLPARRRAPLQVSQVVPVAVVILAVLLTALSFQTSWVQLAYRLPRMHGVFQMAIGLVSVLVAFLFYGRVRAYGRWRDLVLTFALGFGAAVNLFTAIDQGVSDGPPDRLDVWTIMFGRVLVALLFGVAALVPPERSGPPAALYRLVF